MCDHGRSPAFSINFFMKPELSIGGERYFFQWTCCKNYIYRKKTTESEKGILVAFSSVTPLLTLVTIKRSRDQMIG